MGMLGQGINDLNYDMRREMRGMRQELKGVQSFLKELIPFVNMAAQHRGGDPKVDEVIEVFRASQADAQTDYCEKFFADVRPPPRTVCTHMCHLASARFWNSCSFSLRSSGPRLFSPGSPPSLHL